MATTVKRGGTGGNTGTARATGATGPKRRCGVCARMVTSDMRIRQHPYVDWNSPGTLDPVRGEREEEPALPDLELPDDLPPALRVVAERAVYRPAFPLLLPAERFSDLPAEAGHAAMIRAPTAPEDQRERSRAVRTRLCRSCAGWRRPPSSEEFYAAVRSPAPTERQCAVLETWAAEAEWHELLAAWTEHAYTWRELVRALHAADLSRCPAAETLNGWAEPAPS